jgi:transcriptional regulator with XRE-family HTH domain
MKRRGPKGPSANDIAVGRRIRAQRLARGMSQAALAGHLGLSFQQLQKYEKGLNRVSAGRLQEVAKVFGIPVTALFGSDSASSGKQTAALAFLDKAGALRLLRAYAAIEKPRMKRALVELAERIGRMGT